MKNVIMVLVVFLALTGCEELMRFSTDPSGGLPAGPGDDPRFHVQLTGGESFEVLEGDVDVEITDPEPGAGPEGGTVFEQDGLLEIDGFEDASSLGRTMVVRLQFTGLGDVGAEYIQYRMESSDGEEHARLRKFPGSEDGSATELLFRSETGSGHDVSDSRHDLLVTDELHTIAFGGSGTLDGFLIRNDELVHDTSDFGWRRIDYGALDTVEIAVFEGSVEITDVMLFDYRLSAEQVNDLF